jgi:hypothetical protein
MIHNSCGNLLVVVLLAAPSATLLGQGGSTGGAVGACSILTKELAAKFSPYAGTRVMDLMPPEEEALGRSGSSCTYAGITFQVNPFTPERLDALSKQYAATWSLVPEVGDRAYFFDNKNEYAELYVKSGSRTFTIQMDVPDRSTTEFIKPKVLELARAIATRLKQVG